MARLCRHVHYTLVDLHYLPSKVLHTWGKLGDDKMPTYIVIIMILKFFLFMFVGVCFSKEYLQIALYLPSFLGQQENGYQGICSGFASHPPHAPKHSKDCEANENSSTYLMIKTDF